MFPRFGFESFLSQADLPRARKLDRSQFASDASTFAEVLRRIRASDPPVLAHVVTMQNHYPWVDTYRDPIGARRHPPGPGPAGRAVRARPTSQR